MGCCRSLLLLVAVYTRLVAAATTLKLVGTAEDARIEFRKGSATAAVLSATCEGAAPVVKAVAPQEVSITTNLTIQLLNVEATCTNVQIDAPCAPEPEDIAFVPALFFVDFVGTLGLVSLGPLHAHTVRMEKHGVFAGLSTRLSTPFISYEQLVAVTGYDGSGSARVNVSASFATTPDALDPAAHTRRASLPFAGFPGRDSVLVSSLPQWGPPSPPVPPVPPPSPPARETLFDFVWDGSGVIAQGIDPSFLSTLQVTRLSAITCLGNVYTFDMVSGKNTLQQVFDQPWVHDGSTEPDNYKWASNPGASGGILALIDDHDATGVRQRTCAGTPQGLWRYIGGTAASPPRATMDSGACTQTGYVCTPGSEAIRKLEALFD